MLHRPVKSFSSCFTNLADPEQPWRRTKVKSTGIIGFLRTRHSFAENISQTLHGPDVTLALCISRARNWSRVRVRPYGLYCRLISQDQARELCGGACANHAGTPRADFTRNIDLEKFEGSGKFGLWAKDGCSRLGRCHDWPRSWLNAKR
jgi:hypothetical protein